MVDPPLYPRVSQRLQKLRVSARGGVADTTPADPSDSQVSVLDQGVPIRNDEEESIHMPGAFPVDGPGTRSRSSSSSEGSSLEGESPPQPELVVQAHVVEPLSEDERHQIEEETTERIRSQAVLAKIVPDNRRKRILYLVAVLLLLTTGIVVGIAVPLTRDDRRSSPDQNLLASVSYDGTTQGGLVTYTHAELKLVNNFAQVTTGVMGEISCSVRPCLEDDSNCKVEGGNHIYEPGCCLGAECNKEEQCGEQCPPIPELPCRLNDPANKSCTNPDCYTCDTVDGEDIWVLQERINQVNCLATGVATREANGQPYKWAIVCGPVTAGGVEEKNINIGEYTCRAFRTGAGFSHSDGGIFSWWLPCQYIQLAECGCAPADVFPFDQDPPTGPCTPDGDCPFLCSDAGLEHAGELCHAFGGIEWWEGNNAFDNWDLFASSNITGDLSGTLEIYRKDV